MDIKKSSMFLILITWMWKNILSAHDHLEIWMPSYQLNRYCHKLNGMSAIKMLIIKTYRDKFVNRNVSEKKPFCNHIKNIEIGLFENKFLSDSTKKNVLLTYTVIDSSCNKSINDCTEWSVIFLLIYIFLNYRMLNFVKVEW